MRILSVRWFIATIAFANGLNVKALLDSISLGFPAPLTSCGRRKGALEGILKQPLEEWYSSSQVHLLPLRSKLRVGLYFLSHDVNLIPLQGSSAPNSVANDGSNGPKSKRQKLLEHAKALLLTEKVCYIAALNRIYENPRSKRPPSTALPLSVVFPAPCAPPVITLASLSLHRLFHPALNYLSLFIPPLKPFPQEKKS
ncbi:hypothetical protein B0H17DRAFT_1219139 [Mycena rosella]|uniref:DH domain-containing protein n=1 Tax=Mycena rosella TaxID=1033263 RepID=A0AAD7BJC4_MYCRO|nr:hypothetical protein B0H17DRAFT_1219139 [Mycena rosella]